MDGSISLRRAERKALLEVYRTHPDPAMRRRAHFILLLGDGQSWSRIVEVLYCSTRTITRWKQRYEAGGIEALCDERHGQRSPFAIWMVATVVGWVTQKLPRDFGFLRSRWCCELVVLLMLERYQVQVSRETVRRWLHREKLVWRRPRPVVGPRDADRKKKLRKLRSLLANLPPNEIAVFQDEVDINTNPKIGCMWMVRGEQAEVTTPGTNQKRYLAGSLNCWTGDLIVTEGLRGEGRNSALFCRHLDDLRSHLRRYRKIHVVCDNARFHDCRRVQEYLADWGHGIELHFLPLYDPQSNPIERIWWHLHEEITRNHRCRTIEELIDIVFEWLEHRVPFEVERCIHQTGGSVDHFPYCGQLFSAGVYSSSIFAV